MGEKGRVDAVSWGCVDAGEGPSVTKGPFEEVDGCEIVAGNGAAVDAAGVKEKGLGSPVCEGPGFEVPVPDGRSAVPGAEAPLPEGEGPVLKEEAPVPESGDPVTVGRAPVAEGRASASLAVTVRGQKVTVKGVGAQNQLCLQW